LRKMAGLKPRFLKPDGTPRAQPAKPAAPANAVAAARGGPEAMFAFHRAAVREVRARNAKQPQSPDAAGDIQATSD
jgi:hypothetical protein